MNSICFNPTKDSKVCFSVTLLTQSQGQGIAQKPIIDQTSGKVIGYGDDEPQQRLDNLFTTESQNPGIISPPIYDKSTGKIIGYGQDEPQFDLFSTKTTGQLPSSNAIDPTRSDTVYQDYQNSNTFSTFTSL